MLTIRRAKPTIFNGIGNVTLYPCATFSNTSAGRFIFPVSTAKLYRF